MAEVKELYLIPIEAWPLNLWRKLHNDNTLINIPDDFESRLFECIAAKILPINYLNTITLKYKYGMPARDIGIVFNIKSSDASKLIRTGIQLIMHNGMGIIDGKKDVLDMTIRDICICPRVSNALNRYLSSYGHELTVSELVNHSESDLLDNPYNRIGIKSVEEIREKLSKYGLKMKD